MAKDLGNDIDLTLGTGPEALGTVAEYKPPSKYNFVRPPTVAEYFAWQDVVDKYIDAYNKDKPDDLKKLHSRDFGEHGFQRHHLFPVDVAKDTKFQTWVMANFDSFDINDPQWIVIAPTTIAGQKHIENTKGKFVAVHSGAGSIHGEYNTYMAEVRSGLVKGASDTPSEAERLIAQEKFGATMNVIREGIVSADKDNVIFALNLNDAIFLERNFELLVADRQKSGLSRDAAEATVK
jgi:hypothetical protein